MLSAPAFHPLERKAVEQALVWYCERPGLDFQDAYVGVLAIARGHGQVLSQDKDLERLPGVRVVRSPGDLPGSDKRRRK